MSIRSTFDSQAIAIGIAGTTLNGPVVHLATTGSTNALALEAAQSGASSGVWVADEQTAGRGRGGHHWHSSPGTSVHPDGLYVSVLVRPPMPLSHAARIPLATALAASRAITLTAGIAPDIRWPNDLLLNRRKCGGILVETASQPNLSDPTPMLEYAVIGIGLNLNHQHFPPDLEDSATSLRKETGRSFDREPILIALLKELDSELNHLDASHKGIGNGPDLLQRFARASSWVCGKRVRVEEVGGYTGVTAGLDRNGFLQINGDDGQLHTVLSGGVREI